jgi:hypothetical protein
MENIYLSDYDSTVNSLFKNALNLNNNRVKLSGLPDANKSFFIF